MQRSRLERSLVRDARPATLTVSERDGNVLRSEVDDADVPGYYADGRGSSSYPPFGSIVVEADGIDSSDDVFP